MTPPEMLALAAELEARAPELQAEDEALANSLEWAAMRLRRTARRKEEAPD